jgi:hypothetical protein
VAAQSGLIILDTSEIQARVPDPEVREIARLSWTSMSIPQNAIPITVDGHPYLVEIDEFGAQMAVGAGRIIDIGDETRPRVVSNLRLEVHQPESFDAQANDPGAMNLGYSGHYCNVPQRDDPGIVACSMIVSGLRVFDIRDPLDPREIAYFNPPVVQSAVSRIGGSTFAMSSPAFAPDRNEIWYTDGFNGFYTVRLTNDVWTSGEVVGDDVATAPEEPGPAPAPGVVAQPRPNPAGLPATGPGGASTIPTPFLVTALGGTMLLAVNVRRLLREPG